MIERKGPPPNSVSDAFEGVMSLLNPGPYGVSDDDPKAVLIRELGDIITGLNVKPVIIGGIAVSIHGRRSQTDGVDLLVGSAEAFKLIRTLEASTAFTMVRQGHFRHALTGAELDLWLEGELTFPPHKDRFPSPDSVEQISLDPIAVVGLIDLLALKAKSARTRDAADFVDLFRERGLTKADVESVKAKVQDPELRSLLDQWHARALEEIERDRLRKPPRLE